MVKLCQRLKAENTYFGNPRRLWVVYNLPQDGAGYADLEAVFDEGYRGRPDALSSRSWLELPTINITVAEYNAIVEEAERRGIWNAA